MIVICMRKAILDKISRWLIVNPTKWDEYIQLMSKMMLKLTSIEIKIWINSLINQIIIIIIQVNLDWNINAMLVLNNCNKWNQ